MTFQVCLQIYKLLLKRLTNIIMRTFLIAGNWKMNFGPADSRSFFTDFSTYANSVSGKAEVLLCVPFISLESAMDASRKVQGIQIGAQNLHFENDGAYTGEISGSMLKSIGVKYVIVGHSERREYFGESDAIVGKKVTKALSAGLTPILCVGEVLAERKAGEQNAVVERQLKGGLAGLTSDQIARIVVAYEPVWAIGTGETASPEQAQEMHAFIRAQLAILADASVAESVRILYGGSMKPSNAAELLGQADVDGGLIGGASMKADSFYAIVETANKL
jgi:triosephosphate isomerase (TIM)